VAVLYCIAPPPPFALSATNPKENEFSPARPCPDHEVPIVIDTGASWSVTPCVKDFISDITGSFDKLKSLDGSINASGSGIVESTIQDQDGIIKPFGIGPYMFLPPEYGSSHLRRTFEKTRMAAYFAKLMD
jgi:hypothetical protein